MPNRVELSRYFDGKKLTNGKKIVVADELRKLKKSLPPESNSRKRLEQAYPG